MQNKDFSFSQKTNRFIKCFHFWQIVWNKPGQGIVEPRQVGTFCSSWNLLCYLEDYQNGGSGDGAHLQQEAFSIWCKFSKGNPRGQTFASVNWCEASGYISFILILLNPLRFREAPFRLAAPLFGHCPNSDCTPPHSNGHSGTLFFRHNFTILPFFLPSFYHFLWISATNHPAKGLDPPKIKQMPIWTWKILL